MVVFEPVPGINYKYDYQDIFRSIASGRIKGIPTYRELCRKDLFFVLFFGLQAYYVHPSHDPQKVKFIMQCIRDVEEDHDGTLDLWAREHYKMLSNLTPVPTPAGWALHGNLIPGDSVFSPDGKAVKVLARTKVVNGDCYRIVFSDGEEIVADAGHLWDVNYMNRQRIRGTKNGRKGWESRLMTTLEMYNYWEHHKTLSNPHYLSIDYAKPLILPPANLPVEPYTLGAWLGDGHSGSGVITNASDEFWGYIKRAGYEISHDYKTARDDTQTKTIYGLVSSLRKINVLKNKHIPPAYLRASMEQRLALLQGLMDTDGAVAVRGDIFFTTIRKQLASDVADLIRTLGMRANIQYHNNYLANMEREYASWTVVFRPRPDTEPFRLQYHKDRLQPHRSKRWHGRKYIHDIIPAPSVPCRCIQVEGGKYLAGTHYTATHNSTILTYGLPIQELVIDPEDRIGIFSHTRPIAKQFLRQIKQSLEGDVPIKSWFPDVFWPNPRQQAPKWSEDDGLIVKRKGYAREASIEAWGLVDGQPTSKHFTKRIYDDVVTKESVTNPEQMKKVREAYELSHSLGTDGGQMRVLGTHYSFGDLYFDIKKTLPPEKIREKPATDDGTRDGNPVFLSQERLDELRRTQGLYVFACQQLLRPTAAGNQRFEEEWPRYWPAAQYNHLNLYILVDPANEKKKSSDYTVMMVIGTGADENYYIINIIRDRLNLTERTNMLMRLHRDYRPLAVGYEKYGKDSDIEHIEFVMQKENYRFDITPLSGPLSKADRINSLVPLFEFHRIYLPDRCVKVNYEGIQEDLCQVFIHEEYLAHPYEVHDDMLDCLARINDPDMHIAFPMSRFSGPRQTVADSEYDVLAIGG